MFATRGTMTSRRQAIRPQRTSAFLVLFALCALLVLLGCCSTPGSDTSTVTDPVAQAQSVRQVGMHLAPPTPTILTTVHTAQRHLYTFAGSNVGLMQPAVDEQGNVWVGEM